MASTPFDFIDNLNIDLSMSSEDAESTSKTHTLKLPTFMGWQYVYLITHICLAKLGKTSTMGTPHPSCPSTHEQEIFLPTF
jgi:hypothetical protein